MRLIDKMKELIEKVKEDINETNQKQLKDIVVLIDCNLATKLIVDSYIDVAKTILVLPSVKPRITASLSPSPISESKYATPS